MTQWISVCSRSVQYYRPAVSENFQREKQNLVWDNRMIEEPPCCGTAAYGEFPESWQMVASDLYDIRKQEPLSLRRN